MAGSICDVCRGLPCGPVFDGHQGSFSPTLLNALLAEIDRATAHYSWEGVVRPEVLAGTIGSDARAIGGALLPLYSNFAPDRDLFLKLSA